MLGFRLKPQANPNPTYELTAHDEGYHQVRGGGREVDRDEFLRAMRNNFDRMVLRT